jgi:hypothetical protein
MLSTYELGMLAKLAHKHAIDKAKMRRFAQIVKKQATITSDEYRQFMVREERPCHC